MRTANGVELNIKESIYKFEFQEYIFYFSSEFYLKRFKDKVEEFIKLENIKLKNKYKVNIDLSLYFAVCLYKKIEKRGFYITHKEMKFKITELSTFYGKVY